jgi:DNA-binding IclR family transcriptional regulator
MRTLETVDRALQLLLAFGDGDELTVGAMAERLGIHRSSASRLAATLADRGFLERAGGGEAVVLSVLEGDAAVDVAQVDGPHRVGMRHWVGQRSPLHASSDGKVLLAWAADGAPRTLAPLTPRTITARDALAAEVAAVRERGWATVEGELEEGLNGVAVPVLAGGRCVAALSVSGPAYRLPPERLAALAPRLARAAAEIAVRA